jgi:hypothetical protein
MTNPQLNVHGDTAEMRMYMKAEHFLTEHVQSKQGEQREFAIGGYYDDKLINTPDGWRMTDVTLTVLWRRGDPTIMTRAQEIGLAITSRKES